MRMDASTVGTKLIIDSAKAIFPHISELFSYSDQAFDTWKKTVVDARLEKLMAENQHLKNENRELNEKITLNEKCSPISGFNQTLKEYALGVFDDKVDLLRNALLNGLYGDYTLELREDLYKIVNELQPLDVHILQYLVRVCPDQETYKQAYWDTQKAKEPYNVKYVNGKMTKEEYQIKSKKLELRLEDFNSKTSMDAILIKFSSHPTEVVQRSIDRLVAAGLVYNNGANHFDTYNPYFGFIPLKLASVFLGFIADPRNNLAKV